MRQRVVRNGIFGDVIVENHSLTQNDVEFNLSMNHVRSGALEMTDSDTNINDAFQI